MSCVHGLEDSILLKCLYFLKWPTDSIPMTFSHTQKESPKIHVETKRHRRVKAIRPRRVKREASYSPISEQHGALRTRTAWCLHGIGRMDGIQKQIHVFVVSGDLTKVPGAHRRERTGSSTSGAGNAGCPRAEARWPFSDHIQTPTQNQSET